MKKNYRTNLTKIKNIAGMYYTKGTPTKMIVIYAIGAPLPPDDGKISIAPIILNYGVDLFVPDYIGYGRSDGIFTPNNCINTFLHLYESLSNGTIGICHYDMTKIELKYKRVIFIGRSFGGTYIPLLPKFNNDITQLCIISPVVDLKKQGEIPGEETNEDFMRSMKKDGYHHLYRGILNKRWWNHLEGKDEFNPIENIKHLKNVKLFIAHGKKDKCVHFSKSAMYYKKIVETFPERKNQFKLKLYTGWEHDSTMAKLAVKNFMQWIL